MRAWGSDGSVIRLLAVSLGEWEGILYDLSLKEDRKGQGESHSLNDRQDVHTYEYGTVMLACGNKKLWV